MTSASTAFSIFRMGKSKKSKVWLRGKNFPDLREWINVFVGVAALLLAFVSFWTTARISGLEDYLRSEISRRNTELDSLSDRSDATQQLAATRERQLVELEASTSEILAAATSAQAQLSQTQSSLSLVQTEAMTARVDLAEITIARNELARELAGEAASFDLFRRQQAHLHTSLNTSFDVFYFLENSSDSLSGAAIRRQIMAQSPDRGSEFLASYFAIIRNNFDRVCPQFSERVIRLPEITPMPDRPTISYMSNASQEEIDRLTVKAQQQYSEQQAAYFSTSRARTTAQLEAAETLSSEAAHCVCRTLTTENYSRNEICPALD